MLANSQKHRNQVLIGSWLLVIIGAFFAYFDIFPSDVKKIFGYIWLVGVLIQLCCGLYWIIFKNLRKQPQSMKNHRKSNYDLVFRTNSSKPRNESRGNRRAVRKKGRIIKRKNREQ
jgi:hypothetical protein